MLAKAANRARMRSAACASLLALAGGCRVPHDAVPAPAAEVAAPVPAQPTTRADEVVAWPVIPELTTVTVVVRRAGPLARLGHDHVITSADERGTVWVGATPAESAFELQLPVDRFDVDLPESRAEAGAEFAAPVPDDARAGTRRNMLRTEVLDAARFPLLRLRSVGASGGWAQPTVRVAVELRGATREFEVPVVVEREPRALLARGELRINQSDFAITPFAVAGGAIQVADALEVRFRIAARAP
jgi:polyisoprenoid-binding protein YceI